jgi:hypothetical protein
MKMKRIAFRVLIAFVVLSFGYLGFRSTRAAKDWHSPASLQAATPEPKEPTEPGARAEDGSKIIAYYFHVNVRCTTCRKIEAYSKEVIQQRFAKEIASGRIEWRLVNIETPENRHFVQDYQLVTKSLVLVLYNGGRQKEYKVLNDTWQLVGDKTEMQGYVEKEVRNYLRKL